MRRLAIALALALALALPFGCSKAADPAIDALPPRPDAAAPVDAATAIDAPPGGALHVLVVNEVAAADNPDWFEVVNATFAPVQLDEFVFVDVANDFAKAVAFPAMTLGPGERFVQNVDGTIVPFKLGGDEEVWIYRASDHALSDGIDWAEGDAPSGMSFARVPDVFGPFSAGAPTKGTSNK